VRELHPIWDQVLISEFARQASVKKGKYFLEGHTQHKKVALTFDDGPSQTYTPQVLAILARHGVKATFFITGVNLQAYPQIAKDTLAAGHVLGNHSYAHGHNALLTVQQRWKNSIERTNQIFEEELNFRPRLIRPPYGEVTDEQVDFIYDQGMQTIMWSIDTRDWDTQDFNSVDIINAATNNIHQEAIILMHDAPQNRENTINSLESIIDFYKNNDYEFVTVDELIGVSAVL